MSKMTNNIYSGINIAEVPLLNILNPDELTEVQEHATYTHYTKGATICEEGTLPTAILMITSGAVKLSAYNKVGQEQIIEILTAYNTLGEIYLYDDSLVYNYRATALTPVSIIGLPKSDAKVLISKFPALSQHILKVISLKVVNLQHLLQNSSNINATSKIAYVLLNLAIRYDTATDNQLHIEWPITQQELASYAGLTRETISRKLKDFKEDGLIHINKNRHIDILDVDRLASYITN